MTQVQGAQAALTQAEKKARDSIKNTVHSLENYIQSKPADKKNTSFLMKWLRPSLLNIGNKQLQ